MEVSNLEKSHAAFPSPGVLLHGLGVTGLTATMIGAHYAFPARPYLAYAIQVPTSLLILALTWKAPVLERTPYKGRIVAGLLSSILGEFFLMLPSDLFLAGLASFLIAHICYFSAFLSDSHLAKHRIPFLLAAIFCVGMLTVLWPGLAPTLRLPVVLYASALLSMAAQAASRALELRTSAALAASVGACLFALSDTTLAIGRFRGSFPGCYGLIMATYFAAQWGIALSCRGTTKLDNPGENRSNSERC